MTRTFMILLIVSALLFIGFYFAITLYNRFVGGFVSTGIDYQTAAILYEMLSSSFQS